MNFFLKNSKKNCIFHFWKRDRKNKHHHKISFTEGFTKKTISEFSRWKKKITFHFLKTEFCKTERKNSHCLHVSSRTVQKSRGKKNADKKKCRQEKNADKKKYRRKIHLVERKKKAARKNQEGDSFSKLFWRMPDTSKKKLFL